MDETARRRWLLHGEAPTTAMWIECEGGHITAIHALRHPGKPVWLLAVTKPAASASLH